jgi:NAD(P)-dependent dehydrogenase (short-subunit alcohol dehydrogenase family)
MSTKETNATGAVVITGTSTGIGRAAAMRLAGMGFRVFAGVRKQADSEELSHTPGVTPLMIDVTDEASVAAAAKTVAGQIGEAGLRGLVNNAGITVPGPLEFLPLEDLRRQLEVNVIGQIGVTQAFLPQLRAGRGRIVNIGSIGGRMSTPFLGAYHVSKFGMEAFSDSLRRELRPWGIQVSLVEPGGVATPLWERGRAAADELLAKLPPRADQLYGGAMNAMREAAAKFEKQGMPPEAVAKVIARALTAKTPKTRYLVGMDAHAQAILARIVPDRMMDRMMAWMLKLPKSAPAAVSVPERQPEDSLNRG